MSFYSEIVKYYDVIFPLNETKKTFIRDIIINENCNSLLDIGCATGALCGAMAKHLDVVRGFDLDGAMVRRANMFYKYNNLEIVPGNMLHIDELYDQNFDMITCFGNTLVHVGKENIPNMFEQVKKHLTPGGTFILQILNYDFVYERQLGELPLIDNEVIRFDRFYHYVGDGVLDFETVLTVKETGQQMKNTIPLYPIHKAEVDRWLRGAGFLNITYYKNYNGDLYDGKHLPLIVVAK